MRPCIYLDYNAAAPVDPEVADAIAPYLHEYFGAPSSSHDQGQLARKAVSEARREVAHLLGAAPDEIVFTASATEANNLAVLGVARRSAARRHLVVSAIEHPSVIGPAKYLEAAGWQLTVVRCDEYGRVSAADIEKALRPDTALVSLMHANDVVGTLQPVEEVAVITRERGILLHTDAAQSVGKLPVNVASLGVDLLTIAGHKLHATKGVGALYVRAGTDIAPITFGADQERGLRPGTENVPAVVGFGVAAKLAKQRLPSAATHLLRMRELLHQRLREAVPGLLLNGHPQLRLPNTLNVSFRGVKGEDLLTAVAGIVAASGTSSGEHGEAGRVLAAMGIESTRAAAAIRLSVGRMTTTTEVERAAHALAQAWAALTRAV